MERLKIKAELITHRNGKCDMCNRNASDMHELIPRSQTHNEQARESSYHIEVISLLCQSCHQKAQHNSKITTLLLLLNFAYFGIIRVAKKLEEINYSQDESINRELNNLSLDVLTEYTNKNRKQQILYIKDLFKNVFNNRRYDGKGSERN